MAFSYKKKVPLGQGVSIVIASFTATAGAADQTLELGQCRVAFATIAPHKTAEPVDFRGDLFDTSTSSGITTLTVRTDSGITAGTFFAVIDEGG
jgi:hypothetical protein